jgi:hypothetical protein
MERQQFAPAGDPAVQHIGGHPPRPRSVRRSRLLRRIGAVAAVASLGAAMLGSVPAQAAITTKATPAAVVTTVHQPVPAPTGLTGPELAAYRAHNYRLLGTPVRTVVTRSSHPAPAPPGAAANDPCQTVSAHINEYNVWGAVLWTYTVNTYYCWNYVTVTYHHTWAQSSIPGWSSLLGWQYKGTQTNDFWCYYATSRWCSGNEEYLQAEYDYCPVHYGCIESLYPWIEMWELYDGNWGSQGGM